MLSLINLQLSEFTQFDTDPNSAALLPSGATELNGSFADLLQSGLATLPGLDSPGGQNLPASGEALPPVSEEQPEENDLVSEPFLREPAFSATDETRRDPYLSVTNLAAEQPGAGRDTARSAQRGNAISNVIVRDNSLLRPGSVVSYYQDPYRDSGILPPVSDQTGPLVAPTVFRSDGIAALPAARKEVSADFEKSSVKAIASTTLSVGTSSATPTTESLIQRIANAATPDALPQVAHVSANPQSQYPTFTPTPASPVAIETPVQDSSWAQRVGEQVLLVANGKLQNAEIRLTPAELGPLHVRIAIEDGATNVTFHAQHALTREAIEQALPKLRELFSESGLSLGDANVGDQDVAQKQQPASDDVTEGRDGVPADVAEPEKENAVEVQRVNIRSDGLLDTFV